MIITYYKYILIKIKQAMRKFLLSIFSLTLSFGMIGQNTNFNYSEAINKGLNTEFKDNTSSVINQKAAGDTIWTEDFTGGMPAGWTVVDNNNLGYNWVISNAANITAAYTNTSAIASTSGGNHMLLFGDDFNTDPGTGNIVGSPVDMNAYFQTSAINLGSLSSGTGYPAVSIRWQQKFRYCCSSDPMFMTVQVSRDAGFTPGPTTVSFEANPGGVAANDMSDDPEMTELNISAVAGGNYTGDIYIRFHQTFNSHYFWMVDDIELFETLNNDLINTASYFGSLGLPYYQIPDEQVTAIDFYAVCFNVGGADQPNTTLTVDVNSGTFTGTSNPILSVSTDIDTLQCSTQYTPAITPGTHNITWTIASDSVDNSIADNTMSNSFEVTDYIYARDKGTASGARHNDGDAYEIGNYFDVIANQTLSYIDITIDNGANVGAVVYGVVYSVDPATGDFIWEGNTDDYILTSSDVSSGATISLPLFSPLSLTAGAGYLACAGAYGDGGATDDLRVSTSGSSDPQTSFLYDGTDLTWYYVTSTPMVRMNFDPSWGINDNTNLNANLGQNQPNPFNNNTLININLNSPNEITFEITDVTGKIVRTSNFGNLGAGSHQINVSADGLKSGVYFYSIVSDNNKLTKRMIIQK